MIAADTNVALRLILGDDPGQTERARSLLDAGPMLITTTVLLEAEWVLRSAYRWPRERISIALSAFVELSNVVLSDQDGIAWALSRHAAGANLADMLHVGAARDAERFVTFDKRAVTDAGETPPVRVELLA